MKDHRRANDRKDLDQYSSNAAPLLPLEGNAEQVLDAVIKIIEEILKSSIGHRLEVDQIDLSACSEAAGDNWLDSRDGLVALLPLDADGAGVREQLRNIATNVCNLLRDATKQCIPLAVIRSVCIFYIAISNFKVGHLVYVVVVNILVEGLKAGNIRRTNNKKKPISTVFHECVALGPLVSLRVYLLYICRTLAVADT